MLFLQLDEAFVSEYPRIPTRSVTLYSELLDACSSTTSVFASLHSLTRILLCKNVYDLV